MPDNLKYMQDTKSFHHATTNRATCTNHKDKLQISTKILVHFYKLLNAYMEQ